MNVIELDIPDVKLIVPKKFGDDRGFFSETYKQKPFQENGIFPTFVQDNHSFSANSGVLRGLHYQKPPFAQSKLVRVLRGSLFDVCVDIRKNSPTFGKWVGAELSAENWTQLFVPEGFAHGFVTLEQNTEVLYKVSDYYAPDAEASILWNDPDLNIKWPTNIANVTLSQKDRDAMSWTDFMHDCPF